MNVQDVLFKFNAQHDCLYAGCEATGKKPQVQERLETSIMDSYIQHRHHQLTDRFIINMHAFHNAHLLRTSLPRSVTAPLPLYPDRISKHKEFARDSGLRSTQNVKRDEQRKKRATKKAATAAAKAVAAEPTVDLEPEEEVVQRLDTGPSSSTGKRRREIHDE